MLAVPSIKILPLVLKKLTFVTLLLAVIVLLMPRKSTTLIWVNLTLLFTALPSESLTLITIVCVPVILTNFILIEVTPGLLKPDALELSLIINNPPTSPSALSSLSPSK